MCMLNLYNLSSSQLIKVLTHSDLHLTIQELCQYLSQRNTHFFINFGKRTFRRPSSTSFITFSFSYIDVAMLKEIFYKINEKT